MGSAFSCSSSSSPLSLETMARDKIVADAFANFIEANCVRGSDKCVHIQKLEAAFAFYLTEIETGIGKDFETRWRGRSILALVHFYMESLIGQQGLRVSPGYRVVETYETLPFADTRYVVGMDVVRFQK